MASGKYTHDVEAVLATRRDNGADYWASADGRLGIGEPFSTVTAPLILHELKVPRTHDAVQGALGLLRSAARADGRFRLAPGSIYPCATAAAARVLVRFSTPDDPALEATLVHLLATQHTDGGWHCNKYPYGHGPETEFSNPGVTLSVLDVFRFTDRANDNEALDRAVESLLAHWETRLPLGPCHYGIGSLFMQIEFPLLRYNLFNYVYVLSFYEYARVDPRFRDALRTLESHLDGHGRVIVERPNRKLASLSICATDHPCALATARYNEIVSNLVGSAIRRDAG